MIVKCLNKEQDKCLKFEAILCHLLSKPDDHHNVSDTAGRYAESMSYNAVVAVLTRMFLTAKHASVGLALRSLTGKKVPLMILARLGYSITYNQVYQV